MAVGNLEFIKSASGTSVTSLSLTDCFSDEYDVYLFKTFYKSSAEAEQHLRFLDNTDTAIITDYDYALIVLQAATSFSELRATGQTLIRVINKNENNYGGHTIGYIFNPKSTSSFTFMKSQCSHNYDLGATTNVLEGFKHIGVLKQTTEITGLELVNGSSGDCSVEVWGVK